MDMNAQVAIDGLKEAQRKLSEAQDELSVFIDPIIHELKELREKYAPFSNLYDILRSVENESYEWELDEYLDNDEYKDIVRCSWHATWSYGGEGSGGFSFPLSFVLEPEVYEQWKINLATEYNAWVARVLKSERDKKQKQLKTLKKELGDI